MVGLICFFILFLGGATSWPTCPEAKCDWCDLRKRRQQASQEPFSDLVSVGSDKTLVKLRFYPKRWSGVKTVLKKIFLIADHRAPRSCCRHAISQWCSFIDSYGRGGGVGRGLGVGTTLGVGEGLGVEVGVAVGVAVTVGVNVAVGVGVKAAVGVGLGARLAVGVGVGVDAL